MRARSFRCPVTICAVTDDGAEKIVAGDERGSLIVNASGLGKERPGSPLPADFLFPRDSVVWEFNYRGDLDFLRLAEAQARGLTTSDGFDYFCGGWSVVMSRVAGLALE